MFAVSIWYQLNVVQVDKTQIYATRWSYGTYVMILCRLASFLKEVVSRYRQICVSK